MRRENGAHRAPAKRESIGRQRRIGLNSKPQITRRSNVRERENMTDIGSSEVRIFADTSDIVPFWARLPRFFLSPLHLGAIALIAVSMTLAYVAQFTMHVCCLFPL